jgi:hypothetical protein
MNEENVTAPAGLGPKKHKRSVRNILVNKPMQREFSFVLIALLMISTFAVGWVIHHTIHDAAFGTNGYRFGKVSPYEVLSDVSYQLLVRVSAILILTLVVIAVFGIFFLHRVAGPVYRFRKTLLRLNDGEIPVPVQLREGDFFSETASEVNRLIKRTKFEWDRDAQIKQKLDQILAAGSSHPSYQEAKNLKTMLDAEWRESD